MPLGLPNKRKRVPNALHNTCPKPCNKPLHQTLLNACPTRATSSHTRREPTRHTIKKLPRSGRLPNVHNQGLRILGANQQNDIITSEYLEEVHHLQYPLHAFTVLTARSEEDKSTEEEIKGMGGGTSRHFRTPGGNP